MWCRISFLGAAQQVGRSAFLLQTPESNILIDCGINPAATDSSTYPRINVPEFDIAELDAVVISHAHLDHCGFLPYIFKYGYNGPIYCTAPTRDIMAISQLDYSKIASVQGNKKIYSSKEVKSVGLSPERVFETFIEEDGFLDIPVVPEMVDLLHDMKRQGVYVQLLTSRPEHNLKCKYQTFVWLENNNIPFDNINFAAEKYIWLAKKDFYINNNLLSAIDDSPKHAMEYATHGIKVLVPRMPYNKNLDHANITYFSL